MIKPNTTNRFNMLNDAALRNQVAIETTNNANHNKAIGNSKYVLNDDIMELYLNDDKNPINVNIDWSDLYECYLAVIWDGMNLKYAKVQSELVCFSAVYECGMALQFVKRQTHDICMAAVINNGLALQFVRKPTEMMNKVAVENNGLALEYVKEQTEEICKLAVQNDPLSFRFVKDPSDEFTMFAIFEDVRNIRFAKNVTPKMCKLLVDIDPHIIFQLNNPPPELCLYAIRKDLTCIGSVHFNEVPAGPILDELRSHLVMAQLKYGDEIMHGKDNSLWYLPGLLYSYKV